MKKDAEKFGFTLSEDAEIALEIIKSAPRAGLCREKDTLTGVFFERVPAGGRGRGVLRLKKAFTLSEVLIALTVIGVIAAITVPALVQKTQKQEYVSALQKAYSTLSQATNQIIAENGSPKGEEGWAQSIDSVYEMFRAHLNNLKECSTGEGCAEQGAYKWLNKTQDWGWNTSSGTKRLVLADGTQVIFYHVSNSCSRNERGTNDGCAEIWVDINGVNKPNIEGRDVFAFILKENGLFPAGCDTGVCPDESGHSCACKVIREGKMDY